MNRKFLATILAAVLCLSIIGPASAGKKKKKGKKNSGPVVVFEDANGDAGTENTGPVPGFDQAGFDLVKGSIEAQGSDLLFSVEHAAMPSNGPGPEAFRLLWHFNVDGEEFRFTVKSADVGKPDAIAQSGTDRIGQVDTAGHFRLEQCAEEAAPAVLTLVNCRTVENGTLEGSIDAGKATMSWKVPLELIGAKKGSEITGGTGGASSTNCQICWVPHYAERSLTPATVIDSATQTGTYKV